MPMTDDEIRTLVYRAYNNICPFCDEHIATPNALMKAYTKGPGGRLIKDIQAEADEIGERLREQGIDPETMHRLDCRRPFVTVVVR